MHGLQAMAFLVPTIALCLVSCRQDRPHAPDEKTASVALPDDAPDEVLAYLHALIHQEKDSAALLPWIHPDTRHALETGSLSYRNLSILRYEELEAVECRENGDTARCLFAGLRDDRLALDSALLIRTEGRWLLLVHPAPIPAQ